MPKSLYKKLLEYIDKGTPSAECNDFEIRPLQEAGEKIKKSSFNSTPASVNFQEQLKARIREARHEQTIPMSEKLGAWMKHYIHSIPFKTAVATLVLVAVVVTSIHFWPGAGTKITGLIIDTAYAQDNFEIEPTKSDSLGVENTTAFIIKSKQVLDKGELLKNITVFPEVKFDLKAINEHEFELTPTEALNAKMVYRVQINSAYVNSQGITTPRDYSWAFQVKDTFKVTKTLPANKSNQVPLNTGIEITFSHENIVDVEKHISISPRVEGRFEMHGRTVVFVPKGLTYGTIYTVKVDKDIHPEGSSETLGEDYSFSFEAGESKNQSASYFATDFTEFDTKHAPLLPVYWYSSSGGSAILAVSVYKYPSYKQFVEALGTKSKIPSWASYNRSLYKTPTDKLTKITSFETNPQEYKNKQFIAFPEKLATGYYVVESKNGSQVDQVFLQITDLATYVNSTGDKTLLWVNNLQTQKPAAKTVIEDLNGSVKATTNDQGVAILATAEITNSTTDHFLKLTQGDKTAILRMSDYDHYDDAAKDYWTYLYTDRQLYQSNDTVNFWGVVKPRGSKSAPQKVTIKLDSGFYDFYEESMYLADSEVAVNDPGNFSGNLKLNHVLPGMYRMTVSLNNKEIMNRYIRVMSYTKPAYQIEVVPDKKAIFAGEKLGVTIFAKFFEGTPVAHLDLKYNFGQESGKVTTDESGKARVEFPTYYQASKVSQSDPFEVSPVLAEEGEITGATGIQVLGPNILLDSSVKQNSDTKATLTINAYKVSLDKINQGKINPEPWENVGSELKAGGASGIQFTVGVKEVTYVSEEDGEYYDFIEKKTVKRYRYDRKENILPSISGLTNDQGVGSQEIVIDPKKTYEFEIIAQDSKGRKVSDRNFLYPTTAITNGDIFDEYYYLKIKNSTGTGGRFSTQGEGFALGEKVEMDYTKNGAAITTQEGSFMFVNIHQGLLKYSVQDSSSYSFTFSDEDVPNVTVAAVWFDGVAYRPTLDPLNVRFNPKEKEALIKVTPDKTEYKPGENVTLNVVVKDVAGKPLESTLNLNLVDEAFYQLSDEQANPLSDLYKIIYSDFYVYTTHQYVEPVGESGAEGGGDGDGGRQSFSDVALFTTTKTNRQGEATVTFKLPDNITSWRITAQSISADLHAGVEITKIPVSLPLFADVTLAPEYLIADQPIVKARAYGTNLKTGSPVTFGFEIPSLGLAKQTVNGSAFAAQYFSLPALKEGAHTATLSAVAGSNNDTLSKKFQVITSRIQERTHDYTTLKENTKITGSNQSRTTLVFTDAGRGSMYNDLVGLTWNYSDRVDTKLAGLLSRQLLEKDFNQTYYGDDEVEWLNYQADNGGITLVPYSSADLELSAKVALSKTEVFDTTGLKNYFYSFLFKKDTNKDELALSYLGLASLHEPVLNSLQRFAKIGDLTVKDQLYTALALQTIGDNELARDMYLKIMDKYGEQIKPFIRINASKNNDENTELTLLSALLSSSLNAPEQDGLWQYAQQNYSKESPLSLEKLLTIQKHREFTTNEEASFTAEVEGKKTDYKLEPGRVVTLSLAPDQLRTLTLKPGKGSVSVVSLYDKPTTPATSAAAPVSIKREYLVKGKVTSELNQGDLAEVRLYPTISPQAINGSYQITDFIPSGLKMITTPGRNDIQGVSENVYRLACLIYHPYEINGQTVKFSYTKGNSLMCGNGYISYYVRVVSPGTYQAEPASIQSFQSDAVKNYSAPDKITIKK